MSIDDYREQVEQRVAEAAARKRGYQDLLFRSRSAPPPPGAGGAPLSATRAAASAEDTLDGAADLDAGVENAVALLRDRDENANLRIEVLGRLAGPICESEELIRLVIGLATDAGEPSELRQAALAMLRQLRFTSVAFVSMRPDYLDALRSLVDDPNAEIRERVLEVLAREKDEYAQLRLLEDLEGISALVPAEKAVQLLGYDLHAEHFPVLRQIVRNPPNQLAQQEAVRQLSADPSSVDLLKDLFRDKGLNAEVRRRSALALQALAPTQFEEQAREVVLDENENEEVRAASLTTLGRLGNPAALLADAELRSRLDEMQDKALSSALQNAVRKL